MDAPEPEIIEPSRFADLSYEELKAARDEIDGLMRERRSAALSELHAKAVAMGFNIEDVFASMNGKKPRRKRRTKEEMMMEVNQ